MTNKELRAAIKAARSDIDTNFDRINKAIEKRKLPKAAKSTFFYQSYESQKGVKGSALNVPVSKLQKSELNKILKSLNQLKSTPSATVQGTKNRLQERKNTARATMIRQGFSKEEVENMSSREMTRYFDFAELLAEMYGYGESDEAFQEAKEIQESTGKTYAQLYREYRGRAKS